MNVAQALSMAINSDKEDRIKEIMEGAPRGSGFDSGTTLGDKSSNKKLIFYTEYHHMNDCGFYDGWTDHTITVTPGFYGLNLVVAGKNLNDIKDYIDNVFWNWLHEDYQW